MAFRRRRRQRVLWAPTFQPAVPFELAIDTASPTRAYLTIIEGDDPINTATSGLYPGTPNYWLGLALNQGYVVKRIVGKLHVATEQDPGLPQFTAVSVKAGIFVERVDETGTIQTESAWDMFSEVSSQKRWLWRRSWILGNQAATGVVDPPLLSSYFDYPSCNSEYGSIQDGPHIDWKGGARVAYEERLFLTVQAKRAGGTGETGAADVQYFPDLRVLLKPVMRNER